MRSTFDGLFLLAFRENWQIAKAIGVVESGLNEYAVGDDGDAQGLFQIHAAEAQTFLPGWARGWTDEMKQLLIRLRGLPAISCAILERFFETYRYLPIRQAVLIWHYGYEGWKRNVDHGDEDPGGYWPRVRNALEVLQASAKAAA